MVEKIRRKGWKITLTIITLVAMVGLTFALRDQIINTFKSIKDVYYWVLLLMVPLEVLNYHAQTKLFQRLFSVIKVKVPYKFMYRLALELNFVNNVFPSGGVSGISYFSLRLKPRGVSTAQSTLVSLTKLILLFMSFQILMVLGLIMLAIDGRASGLLILVAGSLVTLLIVGTVFLTFIIGSKQRINDFLLFFTRIVNRLLHVFSRHPEVINTARAREVFDELHERYMDIKKDFRKLRSPLMFALLANLAEIAVIYTVYVAFGQWVNPGAVIIAYAVANFAGLVSVLPGGVGIYEALMTAVLAAGGVPASLSLPVTVMYRVLNMAIQLPPGYIFYHRALNEEPDGDFTK
ncbi:flippase-like domain-containing protein [Candidatus Saccharibacteria bacterium]|nr:flippase-like domain-containing protein [Candidatus Saccharibacteria bacterium]